VTAKTLSYNGEEGRKEEVKEHKGSSDEEEKGTMTLLAFSEVKSKQVVPGVCPDQDDTLKTAGCLVDPITF
jgi:hypothetical protein